MKQFYILILSLLLSACTGPTMRTAKTLDPGRYELIASSGVFYEPEDKYPTLDNFTFIAATGVTDKIDTEARLELPLGCVALAPRYQIYSTDTIDITTHLEAGMFLQEHAPLFLGTGINAGKSWEYIEGYGFYRNRLPTAGEDRWHSVGIGGRYYPKNSEHLFWGAEVATETAIEGFYILKVSVGSGWRF